MSEPTGTVRPTTARDLLIAALVGVAGGLIVVRLGELITGQPPTLPWTGPAVLIFLALLVGAIAWLAHRRLQVRREVVDPQQAVTWLFLGKASALTGALVSAGYLTFALQFIGSLDAELPRQRVITGSVATVAGVVLGVAGLFLERACRVPEPPEGDEKADSESDSE